jgi:hypothetical protein
MHLFTITYVMTIVFQEKTCSYTKHALRNNFIPLFIETYGCFHPHFDSFFNFLCSSLVIETYGCFHPRFDFFNLFIFKPL